MSGQSRADYPLWRLVADLVLTVAALLLASWLRPHLPFGKPLTPEYPGLSPLVYPLVVLIWGVAFNLLSLYAPRARPAFDEAQSVFVAVTFATLILAGVLYFSYRDVSRLEILTFYVLDFGFLVSYRLVVRWGLQRADGQPRAGRRVLIVGAGEAGRDVLEMITRHEPGVLEPVGFLDGEAPLLSEVGGYPVLGRVEDVARCVEAEHVDEVVLALPLDAYEPFYQFFTALQDLPVRVRLLPDHVKLTLFRARLEGLAGVPMITLRQPTLSAFERQVKRAFDLILGVVGLVLALPLIAVIAVAIRLDTPGPSFYKQERLGENGKRFWMYKFRSMVVGAEEQLEDLFRTTEDGHLIFKFRDDPRVTRVGRILRRLSLDELPQLVNVLKGEMSLVGPRPELPWIVERHYEPWQWQRMAVPQGLTGWWQVNGRSDKPMHLHTEEDLYYIQNYSLWLDIQILWQTVGAVIKGRGAF